MEGEKAALALSPQHPPRAEGRELKSKPSKDLYFQVFLF